MDSKKEWVKNNPNYHKKWREKNKEKIKLWKENNPDYHKKWVESNIDKVKKHKNDFNKNHPEYYRTWKLNNPEYQKEWVKKNEGYHGEYTKKRYHEDDLFRLKVIMRTRINGYLKKDKLERKNKTFNIVGCTPQELKSYLEKKFLNGMSWYNKNIWHINHIIPLSSARSEDEFYSLCHYTNLQPLWGEDNIRKGNKIL
jgi:hypothetical protein